MQIISIQKNVRQTPRKLRLVADVIRTIKPVDALEILPNVDKRAAQAIHKVIKSALANAKQKGLSDNDMIFETLEISDGTVMRRGRPVSRGRWHPYKRRMSHIRIVLTTKKILNESGMSEKKRVKRSKTRKSTTENKVKAIKSAKKTKKKEINK